MATKIRYRSEIARSVHTTVKGLHRIGLVSDKALRRFDFLAEAEGGPTSKSTAGHRDMNPHLFVYGTLLSTAGHPMGDRLRREARLIGEASIEGQLFSLGKYPGLVEAAGSGARVHGEVYALNAPAASLAWLDAYEGIVPGDGDQQRLRARGAPRAARVRRGNPRLGLCLPEARGGLEPDPRRAMGPRGQIAQSNRAALHSRPWSAQFMAESTCRAFGPELRRTARVEPLS